MTATTLPSSITSFREALGLAFELDDHYRGQTHSIHLSPDGEVKAVIPTSSAPSPYEVESLGFQPGEMWLLLSSSEIPIGPVRSPETSWFSFLNSMARTRSKTLLDWIVVDGDDARSFSYLLHPQTAWLSDPPEIRQQDYTNMVITGVTETHSNGASTGSA